MTRTEMGAGATATDADRRLPAGWYVHESGALGSPAVVFLHGAGVSGRMWREQMRHLSGFYCLAPDFPGFGRSNRLPSELEPEETPSPSAVAQMRHASSEMRVTRPKHRPAH
jgi:pimeloyl-ACP methyl ester carboxylesterase